ncbi:UNVERIFIED_ORG: hypothetical protein EDC92_11911 [Dietzia maris]|uniref:hypothetical protein n=1 Tax=Dietzia maris TaxID=37915 RepID=UPI0010513AC1
MDDMRLNTPEPEPGPPEFVNIPGVADELLAELAPFLAEDGFDLTQPAVLDDLSTLQDSLNRAVERYNMQLFTPVGERRESAATFVAVIVTDILRGNSMMAAKLLSEAVPQSLDGSEPEVSACIGVCLGLLDDWYSGRNPGVPAGLAARTTLPRGHWVGEQAANDILGLARKSRALEKVNAIIGKQGGHHTLAGSVLAVAAAISAWSELTGTDFNDVAVAEID